MSLECAAKKGDEDAVATRLLSGVDPNGDENHCPIVSAAENNHHGIVHILRKQRTFDFQTLLTAICAAQKKGHTKLADELIDCCDVKQLNLLDEDGDSLLHHAVETGDVVWVQKLIAKGADVNLQGCDGYPLHIAAQKSYDKEESEPSQDHITILKILIDHHANPNLLYKNRTALNAAGYAGSADAVALLLPVTQKEDIEILDIFGNSKGYFPWYTEIMFFPLENSLLQYESPEWIKILYLLIENGADLNQKNHHNETLLDLVMDKLSWLNCNSSDFYASLKVADFLLENNAKSTCSDDNEIKNLIKNYHDKCPSSLLVHSDSHDKPQLLSSHIAATNKIESNEERTTLLQTGKSFILFNDKKHKEAISQEREEYKQTNEKCCLIL